MNCLNSSSQNGIVTDLSCMIDYGFDLSIMDYYEGQI